MVIIKKAVLLFLLLSLQACTTLYQHQNACLSKDWYAQGFDVAKRGDAQESGWQYSSQECLAKKMWVDRNAYDHGYALGLKTFCTESNGFEFGLRNLRYESICDSQSQARFNTAYYDGNKVYNANREVLYYESQLYNQKNEVHEIKRRRQELAYYIDKTELDKDTEKRYVKERYRLKQRLYSCQSRISSLYSKLNESQIIQSRIEDQFFAQYKDDLLSDGSGFSIDESVISENIIVQQPAVIVYKPEALAKKAKKHFKEVTKELNLFMADINGGDFRYQMVGNLDIEFSGASEQETLIINTLEKYNKPTLLLWDGEKNLSSMDYQSQLPLELVAKVKQFIEEH